MDLFIHIIEPKYNLNNAFNQLTAKSGQLQAFHGCQTGWLLKIESRMYVFFGNYVFWKERAYYQAARSNSHVWWCNRFIKFIWFILSCFHIQNKENLLFSPFTCLIHVNLYVIYFVGMQTKFSQFKSMRCICFKCKRKQQFQCCTTASI